MYVYAPKIILLSTLYLFCVYEFISNSYMYVEISDGSKQQIY